MKTVRNHKGFTLAELLIVIAIIAALVAIMIPTFRGQVEKAHESADIANVRSACSEVAYNFAIKEGPLVKLVPGTQTKVNWQSAGGDDTVEYYTVAGTIQIPSPPAPVKPGFSYQVKWVESTGTITVEIVNG